MNVTDAAELVQAVFMFCENTDSNDIMIPADEVALALNEHVGGAPGYTGHQVWHGFRLLVEMEIVSSYIIGQ